MSDGFVIGREEVVRHLQVMPDRVRLRVKDQIQRLALLLQQTVKQGKLSGQVLGVRSGKLRRSINQEVLSDKKSVSGVVSTNVAYARRWEYGFQGTESVRAHLRMCRQAFGRPLKSPHQVLVAPFSRAVNTPSRSFLRSALADMRQEIIDGINAAVAEGILP